MSLIGFREAAQAKSNGKPTEKKRMAKCLERMQRRSFRGVVYEIHDLEVDGVKG